MLTWAQYVAVNAPELFLLLAVAVGSALGRIRIHGFAIGASACTLVVAVILGQVGTFTFPPILKSIFFSLFVFSMGFRSGPQFFASLSVQTLAQVVLALLVGLCGLVVVLLFAFTMHLDAGAAAGLAAGSLTQSSILGTASDALAKLGLSDDLLKQGQANLAAGYAVTYIAGYILVLLYVPFIAPRLMGIDLKKEAAKLDAALQGNMPTASGNLLYRKFQARAYRISTAAGMTVGEIEARVGRRAVVERILRASTDVEPCASAALQVGDEILLAGPSQVIVAAAAVLGTEIDGERVMRSVPGEVVEVFVSNPALHGQRLNDIVESIGSAARGVFLRALTRLEQDVPIGPGTRIYVGDVMTLVGLNQDLNRVVPNIGQRLLSTDYADIALITGGIAVGLLVGLLSVTIGSIPLTLGGGGGALVAGLVCGSFRSRRPAMGAFPRQAQQCLVDLGLGGFIAVIGLVNGPAALAAIETHGLVLLGVGMVVTLTPMVIGTLVAYYILRMNPVVVCGALAGAMTVDAAVAGACEVAASQTPVLGVTVPYAVANVLLTVLGPIIVGVVSAG